MGDADETEIKCDACDGRGKTREEVIEDWPGQDGGHRQETYWTDVRCEKCNGSGVVDLAELAAGDAIHAIARSSGVDGAFARAALDALNLAVRK